MTVTVAYSPLTYNCNGSTTAFSVTWPFFLSSDLVVTHITSGGVETVLALTTDYTVSGGRDSTTGLPAVGTVTTLSTYASGVKIRITRSTPRTQSTSFTTAGAFPAKTVEAMIDRVHMIAEEGAGGSPAQDVDGASLRLETGGATDYWDGESYIARGFADGVNDDDLATVGQIQPFVDDAEAAAAAAATSQSAAATSATAASTSATNAATSASSASTSASAALTSATAAASSATAAASSATSASSSASAASTSATNASSSASAASTSASNAATSATEAAAAVGFVFTYSTTTTMADPGSGTVRFNNATLASVTAIAIDDLSADNGNPDVSAWILTFDNSSATNKGTLRFRKKSAPQNFVDFTVTGLTDNSGWTELAVTHAASSGSLSNADTLLMAFYATGDVGPAGPAGSGSGDVNGPASSVASEIALFDGTTGKLIKRATTTGIIKATSGVIAAAVSGTDYAPATSGSAILKGNGAGGFSSAVASTDYAPATSGSSILKGNGSGGFSNAASGTDYAPATSGTAILKGNGSGGFSAAVANTDYVGTTRTVSTSTGLSGGGDLSTNRTIALDVNALTEDTSPDTSSDFVLMYDTSASGHKKVKPSNFATSYAPDVQTFSSSGTWTKPASGTFAIVELWGGGGSGAKGASAGGGGGGAYIRFQKPLSELGATETVTIGAGGAAKATGGNGNAGGNSSFGSHATAYGGAGGLATGNGGGGGGVFSAASGATGGGGGSTSTSGGNGADTTGPTAGVKSDWGGGGGGGDSGGIQVGARSLFGGGGGGSGPNAGGSSTFGGNGGAGSATTGTAGSAKGGGGGSGNSGNSGAGGDGYCRVWVM